MTTADNNIMKPVCKGWFFCLQPVPLHTCFDKINKAHCLLDNVLYYLSYCSVYAISATRSLVLTNVPLSRMI